MARAGRLATAAAIALIRGGVAQLAILGAAALVIWLLLGACVQPKDPKVGTIGQAFLFSRMAAEAGEQCHNGQHVPVTRPEPSRRPTSDEPFPTFSDLLLNTVGERCGRR